jgi:hypothetical protein
MKRGNPYALAPFVRATLLGVAALAVMRLSAADTAPAAPVSGVAVAIVCDTSGSMRESVRNAAGRDEPKHRIANRALAMVVDRLEQVAAPATGKPATKLSAGVFVFRDGRPRVAVPMRPFDAVVLRRYLADVPAPDGGTPLGDALAIAARSVRAAGLTRRHILVLTDGANTVGPEPDAVLRDLNKDGPAGQAAPVSVHFVAFDVAAAVFKPLKDLGATVVGAGDERQLNDQLGYILEQKILLEDEEPAPKTP